MRTCFSLAVLPVLLCACTSSNDNMASGDNGTTETASAISPVDGSSVSGPAFVKTDVMTFDEPWAMTFLPDGRMLVTEKSGKLVLASMDGTKIDVAGVPKVDYGGQGGFGDVVLGPGYANTGMVYLSWVEAGKGDTRGAVVGRAKLMIGPDGTARLDGLEKIWAQSPKVEGRGHFSHRIVFSPDGKYMFIGSGERQKMDPAQDMNVNLGKIVRLYPDGSVPKDNPFYGQGGVTAQIWTLGHRNILGLAFDSQGRLWNQEMGPKAGDELNLDKPGRNYGWPIVSEGDHYDGRKIPAHSTRPEFEAPKVAWAPVTIAPSGLMFYSGDKFPQWKGSAFIGGLKSEALIRVSFDGDSAREAERFDMGTRIREVEQGPDGDIYLLEDGKGANLVRLSPPE